MIDTRDPGLKERLRRRAPEGRYEISDIELVLAIRALEASADADGSKMLCEALLERNWPEFQRHSYGLRHRPDLREDAIANMALCLLQEVKNPKEQFITQNFIHALRCLCIDEFNRVLRQEGLRYRRDDEGRPAGRPQRVPRSLMESLQTTIDDSETSLPSDVADPQDQYEHLHAHEEAQRILMYLSDPLDQQIMTLRVLEGMKWDEIALLCGRNERTVRLRFDKARTRLQKQLAHDYSAQRRAPTQRN